MFHLRWQKSVSLALLKKCAKADESMRSAILNAMAEVEETLLDEPEFVGESRGADKRILIIKPLSVTYKVDHSRRIVFIVKAIVHRTNE